MSSKKAKKRKPVIVEASGVHIRLFQQGPRWWFDVRDGGKRDRVPARTSDKSVAETRATELADAIARQKLLGVTPETLTLGQVFDAYNQYKGKGLEGQWKRAIDRRQSAFLEVWGSTFPVAAISQTSVDNYCAARRKAYATPRKTDTETTPTRVLRDGALDPDFRWLSSVFNWAMRHKLSSGKRLLGLNPLHDCEWPRERNVRRPVATHTRYLETVKHCDAVDPRGRLRAILALARYTGRRESAILSLNASDVLLSKDRITRALAAAGMDVGLADHMPNGAIRWSAEHDKQGVQHITPIGADMKAQLETYIAQNPRVGDVPLFPSVEDPDLPLARSTATKWLVKAETLANLPKLVGGIYHPYRRLWAIERKHLPDVDVAAAGGWNGTKAMKLAYQRHTPAGVLAAVVNARP